jgi:hypothetical protein
MVYDSNEVDLLEKKSDEEIEEPTNAAWEAFGWAWQIRFGLPLENRYAAELVNRPLVQQALRRTIDTAFAETPGGICWVVPELDIKKVDGLFLQEFTQAEIPRMLLMYRDPRDVVLSMVNFLCGKTVQGFGNYSEFQIFNRILTSMDSLDERLTYALNDPAFPVIGDHERALWLLNHPNVCKVSFEELVGARGGGSDELQQRTVRRVADFLGCDGDATGLTDGLYRKDSFSFFKGQIGSWREEFGPKHVALVEKRLGDVIDQYGYR